MHRNMYTLSAQFDELLLQVAESMRDFARSMGMNHSTLVRVRQRGNASRATAERIARQYAEITDSEMSEALHKLFAL